MPLYHRPAFLNTVPSYPIDGALPTQASSISKKRLKGDWVWKN